MDRAARLEEPVVDRHDEELASVAASTRRRVIGPSFFTLSGGILKREPRTSNRIDSVLARMIEEGAPAPYSEHIDKNLDYLHTCLQLDMISIIARDFEATPEGNPLEEGVPDAPLSTEQERERLQA